MLKQIEQLREMEIRLMLEAPVRESLIEKVEAKLDLLTRLAISPMTLSKGWVEWSQEIRDLLAIGFIVYCDGQLALTAKGWDLFYKL